MTSLPELGDRYSLTAEVGRGGTAVVYRGHDRVLDREVAVKLLTAECSEAVGAERFETEIRLTSRLVHPNIVPLFDSGRFANRLFYVMPFVEGETLRQRIAREAHFTPDEATAIVMDVAEALAYAHGASLVHRDVKPENVFCYHGRAMLADFGIAKHVIDAESTAHTETGTFVGTLAYMSPEQAQGAPAGPAADLYSLGCLLFELLTGEVPYPGPTMMAFLSQHLTAAVPRVRERAPATPSRLAALAEQLLAKDPVDRPASALEVAAALRTRSISGETPAAVQTPPPPPASESSPYDAASMEACREGRVLFQRSYQGGATAREKLEYAKALFERGRDLDPKNPHALIGLADVHHVLGFRGFLDFHASTRLASELRAEALRLAPDLPDVHISIAVELLYWKDDFATAGAEFRKAIETGTVRPDALRLYGAYLKMAGRLDEALEYMRRGVAADPDAPSLHVGLADVLIACGRFTEAVEPLRTALRLNPGYEAALERVDIACSRLGQADDALDARRALHGFRGHDDRLAALNADIESLGPSAARTNDIRRDLAAFIARATREDPFVDLNVSRQLADYIIVANAELGEWKTAMDWVEKGFYRRPGRLRRVMTDLPFDRRGLAIDPRYVRILRTAGLEELI